MQLTEIQYISAEEKSLLVLTLTWIFTSLETIRIYMFQYIWHNDTKYDITNKVLAKGLGLDFPNLGMLSHNAQSSVGNHLFELSWHLTAHLDCPDMKKSSKLSTETFLGHLNYPQICQSLQSINISADSVRTFSHVW